MQVKIEKLEILQEQLDQMQSFPQRYAAMEIWDEILALKDEIDELAEPNDMDEVDCWWTAGSRCAGRPAGIGSREIRLKIRSETRRTPGTHRSARRVSYRRVKDHSPAAWICLTPALSGCQEPGWYDSHPLRYAGPRKHPDSDSRAPPF
jgi:hypothetical protein